MLKRSKLVLLMALVLVISTIRNVHAAPTLTVLPASLVINQGAAASYNVSLTGGTSNATYALTLTGLPAGSTYSFFAPTIGPSGSSVLTIQSLILTPVYCLGSYSFTVTATNTLVSSDYASATGSLSVGQVGPALGVSISTDKSTYTGGETVVISIVINRAASGTLTISPPSGSPSSFHYQFNASTSFRKTLSTSNQPAGTWTVSLQADDYCGSVSSVSAYFDVSQPPPTITVTSTTTSTFTVHTATTTRITSTNSSVSLVIETGNATAFNILTSTSIIEQTISSTATMLQSSTTTTATISTMENAPLEFGLASILTVSILAVGISLVNRARPGTSIICGNCGFTNPFTAPSFCVKCGQPLRRGRSS